MTIAKRVRDYRYAKGWGPDELASRAAISRTALYQIECGKTETPRAGTLRRIAQALDVSIESLLGGEEGRGLNIGNLMTRPGSDEKTSGSQGNGHSLPAPANGTSVHLSPREIELLQRKLHDLLVSPMGETIARLIEDAHDLVSHAHSH